MMNVELFRNRIAEQGGDTVLNYSNATLEVYCGQTAFQYKLDYQAGTWLIDEYQIPVNLNR